MGFQKLLIVGLILTHSISESSAFAVKVDSSNSSEITVASNRMRRKAGVYLGVLGDPFPTLIGVNLAYNAFDFARFTAGLGQISASLGNASASATTLGGGARFFVPGWSLSPVAGLSFAYVAVSQSGGTAITVANFTTSQALIYGNIGVDWQAASGFNVGLGYNLSFMSGLGGLPYINLGWYFDII